MNLLLIFQAIKTLEISMQVDINSMNIDDYEEVLQLWLSIPELGVDPEFDTRERISAYLHRNPETSSVASIDGHIIGVLLCGHDGRRGSIFHMGVAKEYRGNGVARKLVERSLSELKKQGITSVNLFVHTHNENAAAFWTCMGWHIYPEVRYYWRNV